jgi:hypothetical protein
MKRFILFLMLIASTEVFSTDVILKSDNNTAATNGYPNTWMMEETKMLLPPGPCTVKAIQIYYYGTKPNTDTIYVVGDPAEGSIAPTFWCLSYNMKIPPIVYNYDGTPGWKTFSVSDLHMDGLDRLVIQHRIQPNGPWFAFDGNGVSGSPVTSYWMNPFENNSLGGPGQYYLAGGDFMVRALVEYDLPDGEGSQPAPAPSFLDVTKDVGLVDGSGNYIKHSDVSIQDVNNDGWDEIIIASSLFLNQKGKFVRSTALDQFGAGFTSWADIDNDGDLDFYALKNGGYVPETGMMVSQDRIVRNNGNLSFTAIDPKSTFNTPYPSPGKDFQMTNQYTQDSIPNPYSCISPVWVDYNQDGKLDLFLANNRVGFTANNQSQERYFPDQLWQQQSNGSFTNTTTAAGVAAAEPFLKPNSTWYGFYDCYGANAIDYNNDSKMDIFVANYRLVKDNLFKNSGNGNMIEVAASSGVQGVTTQVAGYFGHGMGSEWADFNNDGNLDLCVGNLGHPDWRAMYSNPSLIFRNEGPPSYNFTDVRQKMGLKFFEMNAGSLWGDFDQNGYQDLWHGQISYVPVSGTDPMRPGLLYMNQGPPDYKLKDMTWFYGCAIHGPWSAARIDYDHDGDLDIVMCSGHDGVRLFRNDLEKKGDWVAFRIEGKPNEMVPLDGQGTKVTVWHNGKMFMRELSNVSGTRCTQNSNELHFGITGVSSTIDSVVVIYPNGKKLVLNNLGKNSRYRIGYMQQSVFNGLPTPQLSAPLNNAVGLQTDVSFSWKWNPQTEKFQIQIFEDSKLLKKVTQQSNSGESFWYSLGTNKTYYWRLRFINGTDTSEWSSVWNFTVGNLQPSAPSLTAPANNSMNQLLNPTLSWAASIYEGYTKPKTIYLLQISTKSDFSENIKDYFKIDSLRFYIPDTLLPNTTYYWRLRALNDNASSDWSESWSFTTMALAPAPDLTSPPNGATGVKNKPNFNWESVAGTQKYQLQISNNSDFSDIFYDASNIVVNSTKVLKNFTAGAKYWWRIRAYISGYPGYWSVPWTFTIEPGTSVGDDPERDIWLSPNPSFDYIEIDLNAVILSEAKSRNGVETSVAHPRIFDLLGMEITTPALRATPPYQEGEKVRIDVSSLSPGVYFVQLGNEVRKFVKM